MAQGTKTKAINEFCPRAIEQANFFGSIFFLFAWDKSTARLTELARKVRSRLAIRGLSRGVQFA